MKILIYNDQDRNIELSFMPGTHLPTTCMVQVSRNHDELKRQAQSCLAGQAIIVYFAKGQQDLNGLKSVAADLSDIKLIISIPDDQTLFSEALTLYPRFIDCWGDRFHHNIIAVLNKMIGNETHPYYRKEACTCKVPTSKQTLNKTGYNNEKYI